MEFNRYIYFLYNMRMMKTSIIVLLLWGLMVSIDHAAYFTVETAVYKNHNQQADQRSRCHSNKYVKNPFVCHLNISPVFINNFLSLMNH